MRTTTTHNRRLRLAMLPALVLALAALLAGPALAAENARTNSGWYTGLEYADLPPAQPAGENERSNSGWYTGLEYQDLPPAQPAVAGDSFAWDKTAFGGGAAVAALLLAATVVATRNRSTRVSANC